MKKGTWADELFVYHWKYFTSPARACAADLKFIKAKIKEKGKDVKVLILGATPEYRNLCGQLKIPVTLIDYSKKNYLYLRREVKNKPKEKFVQGNWTTAALKEKFDVILGDNVINMMKRKDTLKMYANVSKMLKDDGLFLARTYIREKGERYTGEKAIKEYRKIGKRIGLCGSARNLFLAVYNFRKDYLVFKDVWTLVEDLHARKIITDKELSGYRKFSWEDRNFIFFMPLRKDLEKDLSKFFKINGAFYGLKDYLRKKLPLYVLTKK